MTSTATSPSHSERRSSSSATTRALDVLGIVGLAGIAVVHLLDLPGKLGETPYLGVAYIVLIVACAVASFLIVRRDERGWVLAVAASGAAFLAYSLSRSTGLPAASDDIGNWAEPLGVVALVLEGAVVALGAVVLAARRR